MENKIKRRFYRGLFGSALEDNGHKQRKHVLNDIKAVKEKEDKFSFEYDTYIMGKDNFKILEDNGIKNLKLLDDNPWVFDKKYLCRNKIEMINEAMQEYDEAIWLDWDCNIVKELPDNFWEKMYEKESFQACLFSYKNKHCKWRTEEPRKTINTGFTYIRDKNIMPEVLKAWETTGKNSNDEVAFSYVIDQIMGGWKGVNYYCERYEPIFCKLRARGPCPDDIYNKKEICFEHYFMK